MFAQLQNPLAFAGRLLLAALFLPAGLAKMTGFAGTVGYIASVGLPRRDFSSRRSNIGRSSWRSRFDSWLRYTSGGLGFSFVHAGCLVYFSCVLGGAC